MAFTKVLQLILLAVVAISSAVDYCALPTCLDKHVACNNKGVSSYVNQIHRSSYW